jgi:hypothetical protein
MTNGWPWTELQAGEFPKMRNYKRRYEAEIMHVFGQSDIDIYIIESPLMYVPTPMMNGWPWTDLHSGEFP